MWEGFENPPFIPSFPLVLNEKLVIELREIIGSKCFLINIHNDYTREGDFY